MRMIKGSLGTLENSLWMTVKMLLSTFLCFSLDRKGHCATCSPAEHWLEEIIIYCRCDWIHMTCEANNRNYSKRSEACVVYFNAGIFKGIKNWDQQQDIYFAGKLPWPWSPLLPPGSVKVLRRWHCHNGRQCAGGWTRSERQSRERERTRQRGRGAERSAESSFSPVLAFYSLLYLWSSQHAAVTWSIAGDPKEKDYKENRLDKGKKKIEKNKNEQEDSSPNQLNSLRQVTPMQVINHKYKKINTEINEKNKKN